MENTLYSTCMQHGMSHSLIIVCSILHAGRAILSGASSEKKIFLIFAF